MADPSSADQSVAWKVLLGSIASVVLATAAVVLRLIARRLSDAPFWWDDYTIVAALVGHVTLSHQHYTFTVADCHASLYSGPWEHLGGSWSTNIIMDTTLLM